MSCGTARSSLTNSLNVVCAASDTVGPGVSSHGRSSNRSGRAASTPPAAAPASGWPPMNSRAVRESGSGGHDRPFRAPGIRHQRAADVLRQTVERRDVLQHGRRKHHQVCAGDDPQIVAALVDDPRVERRADDVRPIHGGNRDRRPSPFDGKRERAADQPEPDDGDAGKRWLSQTPHPLRDTGSRQMPRPIAGAMIRSSAMRRSNCDG